MPSPPAQPFLVALFAGGCVIDGGCPKDLDDRWDDDRWDDDCDDGDADCVDADTGAGEDSGDTGADTDKPDGSRDALRYTLLPDAAAPGDTLITSLSADGAIDWTQVSALSFLGDITVCSTQAREGELLVTVTVDGAATPGTVDLIIRFSDGENVLVEDAFEVLEPEPTEEPAEPTPCGE